MGKTNKDTRDRDHKIAFIIKVPKKRDRNPLGMFQERKQIMRDRRERRQKDRRQQDRDYQVDE